MPGFSVPAAVGDHPAMQGFDPLAGGALAKSGDEGMKQAGAARQKQRAREGESHPLMLEIPFADRLRMGEKQARKHGKDPIRCQDTIGRFLSNLFPFTVAIRLIRGILYRD